MPSDTSAPPDLRRARQAEMLANRVRKNARHLRRWARRERVSCYRLYDRDIPEVPLAIDYYDGRLHVAEYEAAAGADPGWLDAMTDAAAEALAVPAGSVYVKRRRRQKGRAQYERMARTDNRFAVEERGLRFYVNLADYLDTGLFLDHRDTRRRVGEEAAQRRVLNLFSYTGAFTVYAAAAGAAATTSVDLSRTYIRWTADNLALNRLDAPRHRLVCGDALALLGETPAPHRAYDLVVLDPPTFSNSKRMRGVLDLQRDHVWLVSRALAQARPGGVLYFSTNRRRFRLDVAAIRRGGAEQVEEITRETTPPDFQRRPAHRAWRITRAAR